MIKMQKKKKRKEKEIIQPPTVLHKSKDKSLT